MKKSVAIDEQLIVKQMGDMVEFWNKQDAVNNRLIGE